MAYNKVVYNNNTLIDITSTTATEDDVLSGKKIFKADGTSVTGNIPTLSGTTTYTMTDVADPPSISIPGKYVNGTFEFDIDEESKMNLTRDNIRSGVTILGVEGDYEGSGGGSSNILTGTINPTSSTYTNYGYIEMSVPGYVRSVVIYPSIYDASTVDRYSVQLWSAAAYGSSPAAGGSNLYAVRYKNSTSGGTHSNTGGYYTYLNVASFSSNRNASNWYYLVQCNGSKIRFYTYGNYRLRVGIEYRYIITF